LSPANPQSLAADEDLGLQANLDAANGARHVMILRVSSRHGVDSWLKSALLPEDVVCLAVVDGVTLRRDLGGGIAGAWVEQCVFALWRRRGCVEPDISMWWHGMTLTV